MRLDRYIAKSRIIEIQSKDLAGALLELLNVACLKVEDDLNPKRLLGQLLERENQMATYLGNGVALPHLRVSMKRPYLFAFGRVASSQGLEFSDSKDYREARLIVLLLASEVDKNYLSVLASLARLFRSRHLVERILGAENTIQFEERILEAFGGLMAKPERKQSKFNRMMLRQAERVAKKAECSAVLLFSDTFAGGISVNDTFPDHRTILVSRAADEGTDRHGRVEASIEVRSYSNQRLSQARSAILIGLSRGLFKLDDRLCCLGGIPNSNQLDTLVVIEVSREFQSVLEREGDILPKGVKIEVVERLIAIATELAVEGREGRPVGTLFVLGDHERINTMVKPLVLNPFFGYKPEDRNILNPFMDETIKEFSVIDGGFVIRGDGVVESAGSLLHAPAQFYKNLPGGYGSRHAAAAAISQAADCLAITISASSGQVTLFRRGVMLPLLEKPIGSG